MFYVSLTYLLQATQLEEPRVQSIAFRLHTKR